MGTGARPDCGRNCDAREIHQAECLCAGSLHRLNFPSIISVALKPMDARTVVGCSFEFDPINNILRYSWDGNLTNETLMEGDTTGRRLLATRPPCKGILDFSRVTEVDASSQTIRGIVSKPPAYGLTQAFDRTR